MIDALGWAGSVLVFGAYLLVSIGRLEGGSKRYQIMNFFGSCFLGVNAFYFGALPPAVLSTVWALTAGILFLKRRK